MLNNDTLELGEGLNIVYAPNESGKSTWCGFIKAMLYGIESGAREKGGVKPDKVKFAPWSGTPMAGSMEVEHEGKLITLSRQGRDSTPFRDFKARFTGTSNAARSIDPMAVGETLLGISRDVFERTAFIGQGKMTVGGSPELEKRISAIVQTGEEKSSVTEAEDRLKAAIRRRRYNKSGRLSDIEKEIQEIRENLGESAREAQKGEELKKAKKEALKRRDDLYDKVADVRKITRRETLDKLSSSRSVAKKQETDYEEIVQKLDGVLRKLDEGVFGREEPGKCQHKFTIDKKKLDCIEKDARHTGSVAMNLAILFVALIIGVAAAIFTYYIPASALGLFAIIQTARVYLIERAHKKSEEEKRLILSEYRCLTIEGMEQALSEHIRLFEEYTELLEKRQEIQAKLKKANEIRSELEVALLKDLDFTEGESEAAQFSKLLEDAENALRTVREESAVWEGRQSVLKDPEEQKARLAELLEEQERLTKEYNALVLALDTLKDAGEEISHRITPRLSTRTAEIFSKLTASRYDSILLDRELKAAVKSEGDSAPRDTAFLSAGTIDQLYLAVRLAICELALPAGKSCPVILDDALVNFDDERCERALELLRDLSSNRQIVLFTCHRREAALLRGVSGVRVIEI